MKAAQIKYNLQNNPLYVVNAVIDNNPVEVQTRLESMGIRTDGTKEDMLDALFDVAYEGGPEALLDVLSVPIVDQGLTPQALEAVYGRTVKQENQVLGSIPVGNMTSSVTPGDGTSLDDLLEDLGGDGWQNWNDGQSSNNSQWNWGDFVNNVLDGVFGIFGSNANNGAAPQNPNYPSPAPAKDYTNIILIGIAACVVLAFGVVLIKVAKN